MLVCSFVKWEQGWWSRGLTKNSCKARITYHITSTTCWLLFHQYYDIESFRFHPEGLNFGGAWTPMMAHGVTQTHTSLRSRNRPEPSAQKRHPLLPQHLYTLLCTFPSRFGWLNINFFSSVFVLLGISSKRQEEWRGRSPKGVKASPPLCPWALCTPSTTASSGDQEAWPIPAPPGNQLVSTIRTLR